MKSNYKIPKPHFLFSIAYALLLCCSFYQTTTFTALLNIGVFYNVCRVLATMIILYKCILFDKYTVKELILITALLLVGVLSYYYSRRGEFLDAILLVAGSANINERRLVKQYMVITSTLLLITFICSQTGIIVDYTTTRPAGSIGRFNIERHGFGIVYATDFAAHILFIYLSYYYLTCRKRKIKLWDYIFTFLLVAFLYTFCDARLTELMIVFSLILFTVACTSLKLPNRKFFSRIVIYSVPACAIITILLTCLYNPSNIAWIAFDGVFMSNRLGISNRVLRNNGVTLFGQHIAMQGLGFKVNGFDKRIGITYLDSSYIQLLLLYGVVSTIFIVLLYFLFAKKTVHDGNRILKMIILILAFSSIINQYLIVISYNPFVIMAGVYAIDWLRENRKRKRSRIKVK